MRTGDEDAADVARVLAGDMEAFEGIVRRWQHRLVNIAWRFCRDRETAQDMAQEAFVKAFRSLATFRGESAFSTWLTAIAVNTYRSWLRAEGLPLLPLPAFETIRIVSGNAMPLRRLEARERDEAVRRAVVTLPARYREAILMYYFEEKDLAEAARILGIGEGTLKARLHRGRELLKRRCANLDMTASGAVED